MQPHFILEGPDCTGKTTIARNLEQSGWAYHHEGVPPTGRDQFLYYAQTLLTRASPTGPPVVFDRLYHGELVYGPTCRGVSQLTPAHLKLLERLRRALGVVTIHCAGSYQAAATRWQTLRTYREEYVMAETTYHRIWREYHRLKFDYVASQPKLPQYLVEGKRRALPPGYVGHPGALFLIVGEQANGELDLPFMAIDNSSEYLNAALTQAGYPEHQLAFVNAFKLDGAENEILQFPSVIALGERAATTCAQQGIRGRRLPHPAYWKRFHSGEPNKFVSLLRKVYRETHP